MGSNNSVHANVQREIWCKEFHFCTKSWPRVKNFPNATIMAGQLFLRKQPLEGGGGTQFFSMRAIFFHPPPDREPSRIKKAHTNRCPVAFWGCFRAGGLPKGLAHVLLMPCVTPKRMKN